MTWWPAPHPAWERAATRSTQGLLQHPGPQASSSAEPPIRTPSLHGGLGYPACTPVVSSWRTEVSQHHPPWPLGMEMQGCGRGTTPPQLPADGCPHRPQVAYCLHCLSPAEKGLAHAREGWETRPPATRPEDNADGLHSISPLFT